MEEKINYDFRTPLQKQQDEKRKNVVDMFVKLRNVVSNKTSNYRIMTVIAEEIGCTPQNIRSILLRENVIKTKSSTRR